MKIAIIVSEFNFEITDGLLKGAMAELELEGKIHTQVFKVPGAFEIPFLASRVARCGAFDGIICLGCLIKGDTAHFEYIASAVSNGIMHAQLSTNIPMTFGVITTYNEEQAQTRSRFDTARTEGNKGQEAARALLKVLNVISHLEVSSNREFGIEN